MLTFVQAKDRATSLLNKVEPGKRDLYVSYWMRYTHAGKVMVQCLQNMDIGTNDRMKHKNKIKWIDVQLHKLNEFYDTWLSEERLDRPVKPSWIANDFYKTLTYHAYLPILTFCIKYCSEMGELFNDQTLKDLSSFGTSHEQKWKNFMKRLDVFIDRKEVCGG